ncbi:restriction endonuclease subunit S domain-containing protein [Desulforapulum autotrophicum]|nr:restriction endonuclease subunit S [Desulforapulum autotrophicum]
MNSNPSIVNVASSFVEERVDACYYKSMHLENYARVISFGSSPLGRIADVTKLSGFEFTKYFTENDNFSREVPCVMSQNVQENNLDLTNTIFISRNTHFALKRSSLSHGEIVLSYTGQYRRAAVVPANKGLLHLGPNVCKITIHKDDPFFITSFLNSYYGQSILDREKTISAQPTVNMARIRTVPVITIEDFSQKYIGNKVRQAETLRAWERKCKNKAENLVTGELKWDNNIQNTSTFNRISSEELQIRLDLKFNSPQRIALLRHFRKHDVIREELSKLVSISAMIGWKGLTTEYYQKTGPWLLRGIEFNDGVIETDKLVCIAEHKYLEQPQIHVREGDIAFSKDGTIGKAVVIPALTNRMAVGSTVARLRILDNVEINPYYLQFILNHKSVQIQVKSFATGVAQPHITQEWIAQLIIPRLLKEEKVADLCLSQSISKKISSSLILSAKLLVEALIENKLTEQEIINAQQALERGDNTLDRQILSRLTLKGIDDKAGAPLFPDLDQLYELLEKAEEPLEEKP